MRRRELLRKMTVVKPSVYWDRRLKKRDNVLYVVKPSPMPPTIGE